MGVESEREREKFVSFDINETNNNFAFTIFTFVIKHGTRGKTMFVYTFYLCYFFLFVSIKKRIKQVQTIPRRMESRAVKG